jgi:hypothetical protein
MKLTLALAATVVVMSAAPVTCSTACPAYSFSDAPTSNESALYTLGFRFTTTESIKISGLGYYDHEINGLAIDHEIGIFDSNGTLLRATTVSAGTAGSLIGLFRYMSIHVLTLPAHQEFTVAATSAGLSDPWAYGVIGGSLIGFDAAPAIHIAQDASWFTEGPSLQFPSTPYLYSIYSGPNFLIESDEIATPEPAASLLLGSSLTALFLLRRKLVRN